MTTSVKQEEILEAIWTSAETGNDSIEAVRERCTVDFEEADVNELERLNLITKDADKVHFQNGGKELAERIVRCHRLAEVLVNSILKLKNSAMEEVACQLEHSLLPEVEESICTLLGHPEVCPDGKPIPRGSCCDHGRKVIDNTVVSLDELEPGESGKVTYIKPGSHSNLHQLISLGLNPGVLVRVHRTNPAFCIKFENTELALDKEIVQNIFVWRVNHKG
ncbi:MAG: metal-dependent transcriptional regulator [Candidatus Glassbacteria bacterium]|nr:metal-dependent transcriptional regulator [Candidatus Glassbacteria bacterium]